MKAHGNATKYYALSFSVGGRERVTIGEEGVRMLIDGEMRLFVPDDWDVQWDIYMRQVREQEERTRNLRISQSDGQPVSGSDSLDAWLRGDEP